MKEFVMCLILLAVSSPSFAKTHDYDYSVPCKTLWGAVKDTLRNSGKYRIVSIDSDEMMASYSMGIGAAGQKRTNSVALNAKGENSCDMQVQSGFSGLTNDDAGDFKKRVDASLSKLQSEPAAPPAKPGNAAQ